MKAKSLLSAVLALMLIMPSTALADQSTTQGKTAYKDLNARTEATIPITEQNGSLRAEYTTDVRTTADR